jgi:hypothetical protein
MQLQNYNLHDITFLGILSKARRNRTQCINMEKVLHIYYNFPFYEMTSEYFKNKSAMEEAAETGNVDIHKFIEEDEAQVEKYEMSGDKLLTEYEAQRLEEKKAKEDKASGGVGEDENLTETESEPEEIVEEEEEAEEVDSDMELI